VFHIFFCQLKLTEPEKVPSSAEIAKSIESENPSWKVNVRKVSKIVKKLEKKPNSGDDDVSDDVSISSESTSTRARKMLGRGVKSFRKLGNPSVKKSYRNKKSKLVSVDVEEEQDNDEDVVELAPEDNLLPPEPEEVEEPIILEKAPQPEPEPVAVRDAYVQEKKEAPAKPCFECAIM